MFLEERRILQSAVITYGQNAQILMCIEECAELTNALAKIPRNRVTEDEIITEIADVSIMIDQLAMMFGEDKVFKERQRKIQRLKMRLSEARKGE